MQIHELAEMVSAKAVLFDDPELAFIAQELELFAQLKSLPPVMAHPSATLVSVPNVARILSLSPDYVWKLVASGELPSVKIGKRRLVRHRDLIAFSERATTTNSGNMS